MKTYNLSLSTTKKPVSSAFYYEDCFLTVSLVHSYSQCLLYARYKRQKDTLILKGCVMWHGILERYFKTRQKILWEELKYRNQN